MSNITILPLLISIIVILDGTIVGVHSFSFRSRTIRSIPSSSCSLVQNRWSPSPMISVQPTTYPQVQDEKQERSKNSVDENHIQRFCRICKKGTSQFTAKCMRLQLIFCRSLPTICTIFLFWFGVAGIHTPVSYASSSSVTSGEVSRSTIFSSALEEISNKYVKNRMFDDDIYDPVESIYREAMDDRLVGSYPKDLKETTSSVLGQSIIKANKKVSGTGFSGVLMKTVGFLRRQGLSEMQSIAVMTGFFVIGAPALFFFALMQIATQNKRSMNRLMKKRYGETYSVDASEKVEEDVDVPDDDEDDNDDDDDDDDE